MRLSNCIIASLILFSMLCGSGKTEEQSIDFFDYLGSSVEYIYSSASKTTSHVSSSISIIIDGSNDQNEQLPISQKEIEEDEETELTVQKLIEPYMVHVREKKQSQILENVGEEEHKYKSKMSSFSIGFVSGLFGIGEEEFQSCIFHSEYLSELIDEAFDELFSLSFIKIRDGAHKLTMAFGILIDEVTECLGVDSFFKYIGYQFLNMRPIRFIFNFFGNIWGDGAEIAGNVYKSIQLFVQKKYYQSGIRMGEALFLMFQDDLI